MESRFSFVFIDFLITLGQPHPEQHTEDSGGQRDREICDQPALVVGIEAKLEQCQPQADQGEQKSEVIDVVPRTLRAVGRVMSPGQLGKIQQHEQHRRQGDEYLRDRQDQLHDQHCGGADHEQPQEAIGISHIGLFSCL